MMSAAQLAARRLGGKRRSRNHTRAELVAWARLGGRPRKITYAEMQAQDLLSIKSKKEISLQPDFSRIILSLIREANRA
jgi:hypothetical protein